jgi:hypothetical protein
MYSLRCTRTYYRLAPQPIAKKALRRNATVQYNNIRYPYYGIVPPSFTTTANSWRQWRRSITSTAYSATIRTITSSSNIENGGNDRNISTAGTTGNSRRTQDRTDTQKERKRRGPVTLDDMPDIEYFEDEEEANFDHSDYNDYYPDFDNLDLDFAHIPVFTQSPPDYATASSMNTKTKSYKTTKPKTETTTSTTKLSLRQQIDADVQSAYDDRMAQTNLYHENCRTCPICHCEFIGGRYYMLHHLFHSYECTKEVPTEALNKLIEQKETIDGVKFDDNVLDDRELPNPNKKKKKKELSRIESRKLHRRKAKKREKEFRQWQKERRERMGSDSKPE